MSEALELMAVAQEQQEAAGRVLEQLEQQQARLAETIEAARRAVGQIEQAGTVAAVAAAKATGEAVREAVAGIDEKAATELQRASVPVVESIKRATGAAAAAADELEAAAGGVAWKWAVIACASSAGALLAFLFAAWLVVPGAQELHQLRVEKATLQANIDALDKLGGRLQVIGCGDKKRKCVEVDTKAGTFGGDGRTYMVIKGY